MKTIDIIITNDRLKSGRRIPIFILIIHFFIFLLAYIYRSESIWPVILVGSSCVVLFFLKKFLNLRIPNLNYFYLLLALIWIVLHVYILTAFLITLFVVGILTSYKTVYHFSDLGIIKETFFKKNLMWGEFMNIILKDNILTFDFKNNKVLQQQILDNGLDEKYFNKFVQDNLHK